jgi:hypothetical protein
MTREQWLAALAGEGATPTADEDCLTCREWSARLGWCTKRVCDFFRQGLAAGWAELAYTRRRAIDGRLSRIPAYRVVVPAKAKGKR